ncbi:MAG: L-seryl-tRNA(Sec) selenium transferase [Phycisphaerae bacterium]
MSGKRALPAVQTVLRALPPSRMPLAVVTAIVRETLATVRAENPAVDRDAAIAMVQAAVEAEERGGIVPVINATGVILHTNLGRAPLCEEAVRGVAAAAREYSTLEYDLNTGKRGKRGAYVDRCLAILAGAEAALVVNNCAAALVLLLHHFCGRGKRDVVISRGELLQIGGGFRVPEILAAARARLCEVGTTNETNIADYQRAISERTAMILRVHRSNFYIDGFASSPSRGELAAAARDAGVPFVEDLGSGAMATLPLGAEEPTPSQAHKEGATLVCFSGDKLFGGPQAGIVTGPQQQIAALRRNPLYRALRPDKLTLAALQATADTLLRDRENPDIPIVRMMREPLQKVHARAQQLAEQLTVLGVNAHVVESTACVGGGSLPRVQIPSAAVALQCPDSTEDELAARLRMATPAVIGVVARGEVRLDLRTVLPEQESLLASSISQALGERTR